MDTIIICGKLDIENNFCPFGIFICPGKTEADFYFIFSAMQKALKDTYQPCSISILVAKKIKLSMYEASCFCEQYLDVYMCKHILHIMYRL